MNQQINKEYWQLIWEKFIAGDCDAFEIMYNEYINALLAYGSKITNDRFLLEDAVHDVFIDVYTYGKKLEKPEYLEFYLFKTLKHKIVKKIKEKNRFSVNWENNPDFVLKFAIEQLPQEQINEKKFQVLQQEIMKLDAPKRELLFLKFNTGLTYAQIGELLSIKPETVKKQVQRIIAYFREKLTPTIFDLFVLCFKA